MPDFNLPADTVAIVPLRHSDEGGNPIDPSLDWSLHSSDPAVTAELSDDGRSVRLIPAGEAGAHSDVVMERGSVSDVLHVTITPARVMRVAFDVASATMEPLPTRSPPAPAPVPVPDQPAPYEPSPTVQV